MNNIFLALLMLLLSITCNVSSYEKYTKEDLLRLREEVRQMFDHAYSSYLYHAYPYDELRPLSCDGIDTWGSYSLSLIDALDTLVVMGNFTEFKRVVDIVVNEINFDADINVSVFETNIRILGGLLSAHLLSQRAGLALEPGWPCKSPLLRKAEDVAKRLLAAFDTKTGMPYGTVNLRHGVPHAETPITCTAGVGTFILEFGTLSRLTGDPIYEQTALRALHALRKYRSPIGLYGNHLDVMTGKWTAQDSGIGAGVDSYLEYLVKGAILLQRPELLEMFHETKPAIDNYLKRDDWYFWVSMMKGHVTMPVFQSLEAYWPGVLSLIGDISEGLKSLHNYRLVWKYFGFTPEVFNIMQSEISSGREGYPLRPELAESVMYLYRITKDPALLDVGVSILRSIQHSAITPCGYATIKDASTHSQEDRMESFFLSELTKYLYLLFDTDNFIHNPEGSATIVTLENGKQCTVGAGGYLFNTEAHPLDPGALECCRNHYSLLNNEVKSKFSINSSNMTTSGDQYSTSFSNSNHLKNIPPKPKKFNPFHPWKDLKDNIALKDASNCSVVENVTNLDLGNMTETFNDLLKNESCVINYYLNSIINSLSINESSNHADSFYHDLIEISLNLSYSLENELLDYRNTMHLYSVYKDGNEMQTSEFCSNNDEKSAEVGANDETDDASEDLIPSFSESANTDEKWKSQPTAFQVDDRDVITPVANVGLLHSEPTSETSDAKFDLSLLMERLKKKSSQLFSTNLTFNQEVLLCSAQPFETKLMLSGEFFSTLPV